MYYNDGIPLNENNNRVIKCPICDNEEYSVTASFCKICGTELLNQCEGSYEDNPDAPWDKIFTKHINPGNARYCEICGKPTYFYKKGILKDYTKSSPQEYPYWFY